MSELRVLAPTPGRVVMFDAAHLRAEPARSLRVPAIVHSVLGGARVTLWAVDDNGETLRGPDGGLPVAEYGQLAGGVPRPMCWCWPTRSERVVSVPTDGGEQLEAETLRLRPYDFASDEPTFTP